MILCVGSSSQEHTHTHTQTHGAPVERLDLRGLDEVVNDGVKEDSSNSNSASEELDGVQGLSKDDGDSDNDNDALGRVGDGLRDGTGLLEGHGSELVVSVEPESGGDQVDPDGGGSLAELHELSHAGSLLRNDEGNRHEESKDGGHGELVSDGSEAILQAGRLHELLVLVTLEGSEQVGRAGRDEGKDGKVELLNGGKDDSTDDDGEAGPLGLGHLLLVNDGGKDGSKGWLGGLDDLSERHGSGSEGKDGRTVCSHEAEGHGGDGRLGTGIGGQPHEDGIETANSELKTRNGHGESGLSTGSLQSKLVGDVVLHTVHIYIGVCERVSE